MSQSPIDDGSAARPRRDQPPQAAGRRRARGADARASSTRRPAPGPPRRRSAAVSSGAAQRPTHGHTRRTAAMPRHVHGGGIAGPTFRGGATVDHAANGFNPTEILRDFDYGKTTPAGRAGGSCASGSVVAADKEIEVAPGVKFPAWTYNGRVPGPTLRCREGELLRIRFVNGSAHPHTMHFHGLHPAEMDGVPGRRRGAHRARRSRPSTSSTPSPSASTSTTATSRRWPSTSPAACTAPSSSIPKQGRPEADEMVMVKNGFNTNFDGEGNQVYAVNGDRLPLHERADPGQARRAGADLPGQRRSSTTRSTRSTSTATSSTTTRPAPR